MYCLGSKVLHLLCRPRDARPFADGGRLLLVGHSGAVAKNDAVSVELR